MQARCGVTGAGIGPLLVLPPMLILVLLYIGSLMIKKLIIIN